MTLNDTEPDLNEPLAEGFIVTWGDKKALCKLEAMSAIEWGLGADTNPYEVNSWPWKWWNVFYLDFMEDTVCH